MSRRRFLSAAAGLAVVPAMTPAPHPTRPDAELLALCAEHIRLVVEEKRLLSLYRAAPAGSAEFDAAYLTWDQAGDAAWAVLERIVRIRAFTPEGVIQKGRSVAEYWMAVGHPGPHDGPDEWAGFSVLHDLMMLAGGQVVA